MRLIFGLVLILGIALAGSAVYLAKNQMGAYQARLSEAERVRAAMVRTVDVMVLNTAKRYGDTLSAKDVRVVKWPENAIPEGSFPSTAKLFPEGQQNFRTVLRAMEKDEAILAVKVTEPGEDAGVSARLSAGMRAFAIRVDVASGVSGFLRPDDRVDVYWTGRASDLNSRDGVTKLIEASLHLLAVDQIADGDRSSPVIARTVTVEATPHQVAALAQAQATGNLSLALVGARDETVSSEVEIDQNTLLGITAPEELKVAAPRQCFITTRRGGETLKTPIPCSN